MKPGTPRSVEINVVGDAGTMRVVDPLTPQRGHVIELHTNFGRVVETLTLTPTFTFQLRAFANAIAGGAPMPTDADDAVISMRVIDNIYRGRRPPAPRSIHIEPPQRNPNRSRSLLGTSHRELPIPRTPAPNQQHALRHACDHIESVSPPALRPTRS